MTNQPTPRCHFAACRQPVTHTVQRLWRIPGKPAFALQHCCDDHIPGIFNAQSLYIQRLNAEGQGRGLTPFYRVEKLESAHA